MILELHSLDTNFPYEIDIPCSWYCVMYLYLIFTGIFPTLIYFIRYFNMNFFNKENVDFFVTQCQAMIDDRKSQMPKVRVHVLYIDLLHLKEFLKYVISDCMSDSFSLMIERS